MRKWSKEMWADADGDGFAISKNVLGDLPDLVDIGEPELMQSPVRVRVTVEEIKEEKK